MNKSESIVNLAKALVQAQSTMGTALKDSKNPFFRSNYADLTAINEVLLPAMNGAGISVLQPPTHIDGKNFIETILIHTSGEFITSLNEVIVAKQNDPQSFLAAQTYTRRGALQAFANVNSKDDDGNTASNREVPSTQRSTPVDKTVVKSETATSPQVTETSAVGLSQLTGQAAAESRGSFRKNKPVSGGI